LLNFEEVPRKIPGGSWREGKKQMPCPSREAKNRAFGFRRDERLV